MINGGPTVAKLKCYLNRLGQRKRYHKSWKKEELAATLVLYLSRPGNESIRSRLLRTIRKDCPRKFLSSKSAQSAKKKVSFSKTVSVRNPSCKPTPASISQNTQAETGLKSSLKRKPSADLVKPNQSQKKKTVDTPILYERNSSSSSQRSATKSISVSANEVCTTKLRKLTWNVLLAPHINDNPYVVINLGREMMFVQRNLHMLSSVISKSPVEIANGKGTVRGWYATMPGTLYQHTNHAGCGLNQGFNGLMDQPSAHPTDFKQGNWGLFPHPTDCTRKVRLFKTGMEAIKNLRLMFLCDYGKDHLQSIFDFYITDQKVKEGNNNNNNNNNPITIDICKIGKGNRCTVICTVTRSGPNQMEFVRKS